MAASDSQKVTKFLQLLISRLTGQLSGNRVNQDLGWLRLKGLAPPEREPQLNPR
jgi:hypothetical protein